MEKIRNKINISVFSVLYVFLTGIIFVAGFMLLRFPDAAGKGVVSGIELCLYSLVPSMLPFMFLVTFMFESGIIEKTGNIMPSVTRRIFGLPGVCGPVIFLSMVGGLPLGAKMADDLFIKGYITEKQGQRMLFYCINPGPSFVIVTVGYYMLGSVTVGTLLYFSSVISSLIIGVLSQFVWSDAVSVKRFYSVSVEKDLRTALVDSVSISVRKMMNVCAWVVLFSCFIQLVELIPVDENTKHFLYAIAEITNGCRMNAGKYPLPLIAGIIGFSGLCAHLQIMPSVVRLKLRLKYFMSARILNAAISVLVFMLLSDLFEISVTTVAFGSIPEKSGRELSLPVCIGITAMSILLLLGDNFRIRKCKEKIQ